MATPENVVKENLWSELRCAVDNAGAERVLTPQQIARLLSDFAAHYSEEAGSIDPGKTPNVV
jgi:hypothetical protein